MSPVPVLGLLLAATGLAAPSTVFDGAAGAAFELPRPRTRPAPRAPRPEDLSGAAARWGNPVQAARLAGVSGVPFRLAVLGDVETGRFPWQRVFTPKDAFSRQMRAIHLLEPEAIVQLGDFVSKGTVANYRAYLTLLEQEVRLPLLSVIGNHDRSRPNGDADKTLYRTVFGAGDFFVDLPGWRLIALDSSDRRLVPEQLRWLENALETPGRVAIFTHVPPGYLRGKLESPAPSGSGFRAQAFSMSAWFDQGSAEFGALVARRRVDRVYMGHIHALATAEHEGVGYVLTGGGGSPLYPLPPGYPSWKPAHFLIVDLGPGGARETVYLLDGPAFALPPPGTR